MLIKYGMVFQLPPRDVALLFGKDTIVIEYNDLSDRISSPAVAFIHCYLEGLPKEV